MTRLVFDTSTPTVSLGVYSNGEWVEFQSHSDLPQQQSKVLFKLIESLLQPFGIERKEITEIAVGKGPGSYTGLRMGMTVAKVWAYAQKIPLYTFSSGDLLIRTQLKDKEALFPRVELLLPEDLEKVEDISKLEPIYANDHFAK